MVRRKTHFSALLVLLLFLQFQSTTSLDQDSEVQEILFTMDHLFVGDNSGLKIYSIDIVENTLSLVGKYNSGKINSMQVQNNKAYLMIEDFGLKIVDITSLESPALLAEYYIHDFSNFGLDVSDNYIYTSNIFEGIYIFTEDSGAITKRGEYSIGDAEASQILVGYDSDTTSEFLILAHSTHLKIINVTDYTSPNLISEVPTFDYSINAMCWCHPTKNDDYFCIVSEIDHSVLIYNITTLTSPTLESSYSKTCSDVSYRSGLLRAELILATNNGLSIFDIYDLADPTEIGTNYEFPEVSQVTHSGEYVYAASKQGDILYYDISDSSNPILIIPEQPFNWLYIVIGCVGGFVVILITSLFIIIMKKRKTATKELGKNIEDSE